jgi:hypothetical protein
MHGQRVERPDELAGALRAAFAHDGAALVDVMVARQELSLPPTITLDQVKGFTPYADAHDPVRPRRRPHRPRKDQRHQEALLVKYARGSGIGRLAFGAVAGAVAGAVGTAAIDLRQYRRYRRDGGKESLGRWELAAGVTSWEEASAPGQIGQKLARFVTRRSPPDRWARAATNLVHWTTGVGWGLQYGVLGARTPAHPWARALALGPAVWLSGYAILPLVGVYEPIWKYDARTLGKDLSDHLVFGAATSCAFAVLTREQP